VAEVRFTRKALDDLAAIHAWLAERNPPAAARVIAAIEKSASLLADNPQMGRPEDRGLGRILVVPGYHYVISYRIERDTVEIRFVFHPRQSR
jgi:plasmid stabilization system protein ParE